MNKLRSPAGHDIAYVKTAPRDESLPSVIFLGGYRSDMEGTKALFLEGECAARGQGFVRFDYAGHGTSGGDFMKGTIGSWMADALHVMDTLTEGPVILVGSSMGGWISLLCALKRPDRVRGVIGLAAAPDFTRIVRAEMTPDHQRQMDEKGYFEEPNDYSSEPYVFTRALLDDGENHCLLDGPIPLAIPVRLIQGMADADVAWQTADRIKKALMGPDVEVFLVESGDHRLSRPEDLALLGRVLADLTDIAAKG